MHEHIGEGEVKMFSEQWDFFSSDCDDDDDESEWQCFLLLMYYYFFVQLGFNCGPEARVDTGVMLDPVLFGATVGFEFWASPLWSDVSYRRRKRLWLRCLLLYNCE